LKVLSPMGRSAFGHALQSPLQTKAHMSATPGKTKYMKAKDVG
jgi:hypothetical protein